MTHRTAALAAVGAVGLLLLPGTGFAQAEPSPEATAIEMIRRLDPIGDGDQTRIGDWVRVQIDRLAQIPEAERQQAGKAFRQTFRSQFGNSNNTPAFKTQFVVQTARKAEEVLTRDSTDLQVAFAVARVLVDFNRAEALPGLLAGLKSQWPVARYLSARGIQGLHQSIVSEKDKSERVITALREAANAEKDGVALGQIYRAISACGQGSAALDAYLAIMESRLAKRQDPESLGAEIAVYQQFRDPAAINTLNQGQKVQLVSRLAGFLRVYTERYNTANLDFDEIDRLERGLALAEEILETAAGTAGGTIRRQLEDGGYDRRGDVATEAFKWIGDPNNDTPGTLNAAPWNVPMGGLNPASGT